MTFKTTTKNNNQDIFPKRGLRKQGTHIFVFRRFTWKLITHLFGCAGDILAKKYLKTFYLTCCFVFIFILLLVFTL